MRIAIFSDTFPPEINGVATSSRNLMKTLVDHGEEVVVVTTNPYSRTFSFLDHIIRIPGLEMKHLYGYRAAGPYNKQAMAILRDFKPDVVHVQTDAGIGQFGYFAANRLHAAVVATFHTSMEDYTYYATKGHFDRLAKGTVRLYVRFLSIRADEFITPSEKTHEYMRSIGVDSFVNVVPTGLDFSAFKKENIDAQEVARIKKGLGLPPEAYVILSLGRVAQEKAIDICLKGYAHFLAAHPLTPTVFLVVGGGPALDSLRKLSDDLGIADHVVFSGPVSPDLVPLYYQLGDCFVSASITETQGLTFMEAMASSLVLLCRYDDTLAHTIIDDVNGYFFLDEHDFSEKLLRIISLSAPKLKEIHLAEETAIAPYALKTFGDRIIEVYQRAIKKNW